SRGRDPDDQEGDARAQGDPERFVQEIYGGGRPRRLPESVHPQSRGRDAETRRDDRPRPAHQARREAGGSRDHREDGGRGLGHAGDWIVGDESGLIVVPQEQAVEMANRAIDVLERENRIREEIKRGGTLSSVLELEKWEQIR